MAKDDDDFKFPDEIEEKSKGKPGDDIEVSYEEDDGDIKIEIEDDTPPEDRHVQPLTDEVKDDLEKADESKDYSHNVKTKFKQYKKAWHDERRAKESAYREQQEALQIAQNNIDTKALINSIFAYSPKKNKAKLIAEYSTLYPETNSASASGKSKGCRFVSASIDTQNITNIGNKGTINQMFF